MQNLIAFLIKNISWFFFILLEIISFWFIFQYNSYQRSIFFNFSNEITGHVYTISGEISSYFGLRKNNDELLLQTARLNERIFELENQLRELKVDTTFVSVFADSSIAPHYSYTIAHVLDNSVNRVENYITVNKGSKHGITTEMGVVSQHGIVGFVRSVSPNYSLVQSVLNPKTQLNCKIKRSNVRTTLVWDTKDPRYAELKDFPRFETFQDGDTVITSGVSKFFPEGFIVGVIDGHNEGHKSQKDDNFLTLRIKLATDFSSLNNVLIINNYHREELRNMRKEVGIE